jgi:sulfate adenylyltransferase subunit 1
MITDILRFTTAGSVDDGKSTLIGRLLYDSKSIFEDQLEAITQTSQRRGDANLDLSLLTDGLRAEREQGITIDVAYRYFATPHRKFIIADTPGHIQYTRNMVTGASTAQLAIVLIDARQGVIEQTRRHAFLANLLRIQHVVVAVNKMDLVNWDEATYLAICEDFKALASRLEAIVEVVFIPISALHGDNVVTSSPHSPWYHGSSLLYHLENVYIGPDANHVDARFPVQCVIRPHDDAHHDFRGYAGRVAGGVFKPGDEVIVLPAGFSTQIKAIHGPDGPLSEAFHPQSVTLELCHDFDISRGDMIAKPHNQPSVSQDLEAMVCWFSAKRTQPVGRYVLRHTSREVKALLTEVRYLVDIQTLHKLEDVTTVGMNDILRVTLRTSAPVLHDPYRRNRQTGGFILVDEHSNETVAAGMIL